MYTFGICVTVTNKKGGYCRIKIKKNNPWLHLSPTTKGYLCSLLVSNILLNPLFRISPTKVTPTVLLQHNILFSKRDYFISSTVFTEYLWAMNILRLIILL